MGRIQYYTTYQTHAFPEKHTKSSENGMDGALRAHHPFHDPSLRADILADWFSLSFL